MKCPLCQSNSKFALEVKGFKLLDCKVCKHRFAALETNENHADTTYDDSYFNDGGAGYSNYSFEAESLRERGRMYARKIKKFTNKEGSVLDVGAAAGFILQGFIDEGWGGSGIEPNKKIAKIGREEFGLHIEQGTLENFKTDEKYDLISMVQVVAHFWDQQKAFENATDILNDNGLLLIETWNRESLTAKLFGKNWHEYSPPSVLHWFSLNGLTEFLKTLGFELIAKGRPRKNISGKHVKSLLEYRIGKNYFLDLIPDRINIPYPSEDLFWALYRKTDFNKAN